MESLRMDGDTVASGVAGEQAVASLPPPRPLAGSLPTPRGAR